MKIIRNIIFNGEDVLAALDDLREYEAFAILNSNIDKEELKNSYLDNLGGWLICGHTFLLSSTREPYNYWLNLSRKLANYQCNYIKKHENELKD